MEHKVKLCIEVDTDGRTECVVAGTKREIVIAFATLCFSLMNEARISPKGLIQVIKDVHDGFLKDVISAAEYEKIDLSELPRKDEGT